MKITDEAVEAAAKALDEAVCVCPKGRNQYGGWYSPERTCPACGDNNTKSRVALLAALPHLEGATPAQPMLAEILAVIDGERGYMDNWAGRARNDALTDAREAVEKLFQDRPATPAIDREALVRILESYGVGRYALVPDLYRSELADKVLALIGGAS